MQGVGAGSPFANVQHQLILGDEAFARQHKNLADENTVRDVSKAQKRLVVNSLEEYQSQHPNRDEAMARAYLSGAYSMREIGDFFGVHAVTVGRAVRGFSSHDD